MFWRWLRKPRRKLMRLLNAMGALFRTLVVIGVSVVLASVIWTGLYSAPVRLRHVSLSKRSVFSPHHNPDDNTTWRSVDQLLVAGSDGHFRLKQSHKRIISGEFHYFRTHPSHWDDRLRRMRTAGVNTIWTHVPWNIHEHRRGVFEFDGFWNLSEFMRTVHRLGFLLIVGIGPYIDCDWEFGGLPSWLLQDPNMVVRSSTYPPYMNYVERYLRQLLPLLARYTYRRHGPVVALQVENQFGSYGVDNRYMSSLVNIVKSHGIDELLLSVDSPQHLSDSQTPRVLSTSVGDPTLGIDTLRTLQPGLPLLVSVTSSPGNGVTRWGEPHLPVTSPEWFQLTVNAILSTNASLNVVRFAGGTNFGLWNGALDSVETHALQLSSSRKKHKRRQKHGKTLVDEGLAYRPVTTSYDCQAVIPETGRTQHSKKYHAFRQLLLEHHLISRLQAVPPNPPDIAFGLVHMDHYMPLETLTSDAAVGSITLPKPVFMERLNTRYGSGQDYGWIVYRTTITRSSRHVNITGTLRDRGQVFFDGHHVVTVYNDKVSDCHVTFNVADVSDTSAATSRDRSLEIIVENMGRASFGLLDEQRKGFEGRLVLDGIEHETSWEHFSLDFSKELIELVRHKKHVWRPINNRLSVHRPALYRGHFKTKHQKDTFIDMSKWTKGVVILNGFVVGRYWNVGPQHVLYVPGPLLVTSGTNELIIFELERAANNVNVKLASRPDHSKKQ